MYQDNEAIWQPSNKAKYLKTQIYKDENKDVKRIYFERPGEYEYIKDTPEYRKYIKETKEEKWLCYYFWKEDKVYATHIIFSPQLGVPSHRDDR